MTIHLPKVNQFGGGNGGGGGSSSFPTLVTDSGSSLPSASGYQLNDTFLNTSDKKIYKTSADGYELNTDVTNTATLDLTTGIVTHFISSGANQYYTRNENSNIVWKDNLTIKIHFKIPTTTLVTDTLYGIYEFASLQSQGGSTGKKTIVCLKNKELYLVRGSYSSGPTALDDITKLLNYEIQFDTEYYLEIIKNGNSVVANLYTNGYDDSKVATGEIETVDWYYAGGTGRITVGGLSASGSTLNMTYIYALMVYLLDTTGDFLKASSELSWDNGTDLTDKTEYADKTNGILYLYEDTELIQIPQKNTLSFTNVSASSWVSDSTYTDYGYKCELSCSGVTANDFAQVIFAPTEADSGNYATVCQTGSGTVTIYSKVNDSITIPSIVVMGV